MAFPSLYILGLFGIVIVDLTVAQTWPSSRGLLQKSGESSNKTKDGKEKSRGRKQDGGPSSCSGGGKIKEINQNEFCGSPTIVTTTTKAALMEGSKKR